MTSNAVREAVASCIAQASGIEITAAVNVEEKESWRTPMPPVDEGLIIEEKSADFIVIGAAHSGGAVIRSIADAEKNTVIGIEKMSYEGFFTMGNDIGHFNSQVLRNHGVPDQDPIEMYNDWMRRTLNSANPSLIMQYCQHCGEDIDWWMTGLKEGDPEQFTVAFNPPPEHLLSEVSGYKFYTGTIRATRSEGAHV